MKNKLLIATNNAHKVKEIRQILDGKFEQILTLNDVGIDVDVVEDGDTFLSNALKKAETVGKLSGMITLADDTGLEVTALSGEPGIKSARYSIEHNDEANNVKLLKKMQGVSNRDARFVSVVVLYYPSGEYIFAKGEVTGSITRLLVGQNGFGYDSLFFCDELGKTFGEAADYEKNTVSHRARALNNLLKKL